MKTSKNRILQSLIVVILFLITITGCSKNDDGESLGPVKVQTSKVVKIGEINGCSTSLGSGTRLSFVTPYTAEQGVKIARMLIKTKVSDGGSNDAANTKFTNNGTNIEWASCFTYGSQNWVEYEVRLETTSGLISNVSIVRVNKPDGAN